MNHSRSLIQPTPSACALDLDKDMAGSYRYTSFLSSQLRGMKYNEMKYVAMSELLWARLYQSFINQ